MSKKYLLLFTLILGLVNLWYWWPASQRNQKAKSNIAQSFHADEFRLKVTTTANELASTRDLFQAKVMAPPVKPKKIEAKIQLPPPIPEKTPEQLAEEAARAELAQIKLVGIVSRGSKPQAFLLKGDQAIMVFSGDKAGDRFTVEAIDTDSVQLKDPQTKVTGQISMSGK